jgi:quercetin dioxygenase-like cupin family protein
VKIINHYSELAGHTFFGDTAQGVTGRVAIGAADGASHFCMRIFTIEPQGHTLRHEHAWEHEIVVHSGKGQVLQEGAWRNIAAGSVLFIPSHETHQIRNDSEEDLVFVCLIPAGAPEL